MKKVGLIFVLAVLAPSLVLAWLAIRSLRDQQLILERQQALLYQGATDAFAEKILVYLNEKQREFEQWAENLLPNENPRSEAFAFDEKLRRSWPHAEVGFAVTLDGQMLTPPLNSSAEAKSFRRENELFLANSQTIEVYPSQNEQLLNYDALEIQQGFPQSPQVQSKNIPNPINEQVTTKIDAAQHASQAATQKLPFNRNYEAQFDTAIAQNNKSLNRNVFPQKGQTAAQAYSKSRSAEAEFHQIIGQARSGTFARFLQNKLKLMFWHRSARDPQLILGAQIKLQEVVQDLTELLKADPNLYQEICIAILDDTGKPVVVRTPPPLQVDWKRPFVATEIGEILPHWEVTAYLLDPGKLNEAAQTLKLTIGLMICLMISTIGVGSCLIIADLKRQLTLARQKTDFVSNVSHELKTPLTSIRMFSELLAEGRVSDSGKRRDYLQIISAEAARLTRLINNVLDFGKMERGEKKYHFVFFDFKELVLEIINSYQPHLEANGFQLNVSLPDQEIPIKGDRDALAQVIMNLISNAEKYGGEAKEITIEISIVHSSIAILKVMDRGLGVPAGSEEKIFEQFYRAHDSLSSGIQGSGLGLTLARQIARAHGGDITYEQRDGGGSCFTLELKLKTKHEKQNSGG